MGKAKAIRKLIKKGITAVQKKRTKENKRLAATDPERLSLKKQKNLYASLDKKVMDVKSELRKKYGDNHQAIVDSPEYRRMLNKKLTEREKELLEDRKRDAIGSGEFELFLPFNKQTENRIRKQEAGIRKAEREAEDGPQPFDRGGDVVQPKDPLTLGAAKKLAKGLREKKDKTAQQRFLTGFASGVFKLTPADRYMKTYGKQARAKTRKDK